MKIEKNVLGTDLQHCCMDPKTGFYRTGFCRSSEEDQGNHSVCTLMTERFLTDSRKTGNDLSTPRPEFDFPGLKSGDHWCVCASRWLYAFHRGEAAPVILEATHERALEVIPLEFLKAHAVTL